MRNAVLLDTCALLWLGIGSNSLSQIARETIEETETVLYRRSRFGKSQTSIDRGN